MPVNAFTLVPVSENITIGEKVRAQISSLEYCDKSLFLGTADSFVVEYKIDEKAVYDIQPLAPKTKFACNQRQYKYLGLKKPVLDLKALFVLERIVCICDNTLIFLNYHDLEQVNYGSKLKNVNAICINENSPDSNPFSVQVCIARKKTLAIFNISSDRLTIVKEVSLPGVPLVAAIDRSLICTGTESQFYLVNWETNDIKDLCSASEESKPFALRTGNQFLISAPGSLGLFVNASGCSERAPICFKPNVVSISYSNPHVIALSSTSLAAYSVSDQQLKQEISFTDGRVVANLDGTIFAASRESIFALQPVPWETQVQMLLADKQVNEALELSRNWHQAGLSREAFRRAFAQIQQQAGFVELLEGHLEEARHLFISGSLHVRELLCLFPFLTPSVFSYVPSSPPLHALTNFRDYCADDEDRYTSFQHFAVEYLSDVKASLADEYAKFKGTIDASFVVLCARLAADPVYADKLIECVSDSSCELNSKAVIGALEENNCHHALALYYFTQTQSGKESGLEIWKKLETKQLIDNSYPGLGYLITILCEIDDIPFLLRHVDFVLERDQHEAVNIFTNRTTDQNALGFLAPESVIEHLQRYPEALRKYLEFLIFDLKSQKENFHTHLVAIYLNDVVTLKCEEGSKAELNEARERLQSLLEFSSSFRTHLILAKALDAGLHKESAILYGKIGEHEKALSILTHQLKDYKAAEMYCIKHQTAGERYRLFHSLLGIYLHPALKEKEREIMYPPALELLNSEQAEFDVVRVLRLIPKEWQCSMVERFMVKGLRRASHGHFNSAVQRALTRHENVQSKVNMINIRSRPVFVSQQSLCSICRGHFDSPDFVLIPFQSLVHRHCIHKNNSLTNKVMQQ